MHCPAAFSCVIIRTDGSGPRGPVSSRARLEGGKVMAGKRTALALALAAAALLVGTAMGPASQPNSARHGVQGQGLQQTAHAEVDGLALTPPMGWYPWNMFGEEPQNEKLIREIADALVASGMKDAGYAYVGPDEGICFSRGADGKLTPNLERYPSGLRGLGDYIHARASSTRSTPTPGSKTCSAAMPGTKDHEFEDMRSFAEWRADYIKIDWCNTEGQDIVDPYSLLGEAQRAAGRPVVHSLCSWGDGYPWNWAGAIGHMWRTTVRHLRSRQGRLGPGPAHRLRQREAGRLRRLPAAGTTRT